MREQAATRDVPTLEHSAGVPETAGPQIKNGGDESAESISEELMHINQELACILDRSPAPLVSGADTARRDPLVICGLLGGKDVGKSTLINALAGQAISVDREEVGAGTSRPLVYVHRDMIGPARNRLRQVGRSVAAAADSPAIARTATARVGGEAAAGLARFFPHQADSIRNVALVDLPDFDSDFREHEAIARAVAPFLDRVIWVVTPRKIADRAWVAFARDVIKANTNIYFVLNKSDELLADEEGWSTQTRSPHEVQQQAEQFARQQRDWACQVLRQSGYEVQDERLCLVAAQYPQAGVFVQRVAAIWDDPQWRHYREDRDVVAAIGQRFARELHRIREMVLAPVDAETAAQIKQENLRAQVRQNVSRVRAHFDLDFWIEQISGVLDPEYRQSLLNSAFGPEVCRLLSGRLLRSRRADVELADEVMDARAGRWPLLRVVYWLSRWAIRRLGRAVSGGPGRDTARQVLPAGELFYVRARHLSDRAALVTDRLKAEHAPLLRQLRLQERLPHAEELSARVESELAELPLRGDEEIVDELSRDYRPSLPGRILVWAVLLWFPFVQPVTEGLLEMSAAGWGLSDWLRGLYRVVFALGASQILYGIIVVIIIYVAFLSAVYGRCVRQVQAARALLRAPSGPSGAKPKAAKWHSASLQEEIEAVSQDIDAMLLAGVIDPILRPIELAGGQLDQLRHRLHEIAA